MDMNAFAMLCDLIKTRGGLLDYDNVTIEEQIASFVIILAHHNKNRRIQVIFCRSGETISRYVHQVLRALLRLEDVLFVKLTPVPDVCMDSQWQWFKGIPAVKIFLYHIEVQVAAIDTPLLTPRVNGEASRLVVSLRRTLFESLYVESGFNSI
ncbi:hypothetical protein LWI29_000630 [Acer saccharum]|uniref:DUF8040 domain-containing protein n=1 Tax=Acer saccharum TaxID=4024 RepID=A0AA39RPF6_ACESA|nr:hypothetical protein LWI29_000630 [Acer saccharum]